MAANQPSAGDAIMSAFNETPPITRFYAAATFIISLSARALGLLDPGLLVYHWDYLRYRWPPQVWRIVTAFFLTRPKLAILFNSYWLYDYGRRLEKTKFRWSGEFLLYIFFIGAFNIIVDSLIFGGAGVYAENIITAFLYTWAQEHRNQPVRFWFITMQSQWYPFAYVVAAMIMDGPTIGKSLSVAIAAAHMYEFLTKIYPTFGGGRNFLETPRCLQFNFEGGPVGGRGSGSRPQRGGTTGGQTVGQGGGLFSGGGRSTSAATGSGSGASLWRSRGQGQRLGGS